MVRKNFKESKRYLKVRFVSPSPIFEFISPIFINIGTESTVTALFNLLSVTLDLYHGGPSSEAATKTLLDSKFVPKLSSSYILHFYVKFYHLKIHSAEPRTFIS